MLALSDLLFCLLEKCLESTGPGLGGGTGTSTHSCLARLNMDGTFLPTAAETYGVALLFIGKTERAPADEHKTLSHSLTPLRFADV